MPKLRRVSGQETVRALERLGFEKVRQRGSHVILKKQTPEGIVGCVVLCITNWRLVHCEAF
jgi:predicted RNA binding protein YcfA (HicA-like mRNA interferase family)